MNTGFNGKRKQRGLSLIELLVAVLLMGIAVLGITALQMVSLQNNRAALYRAEAVQLAYDMMDRIRANPDDGVAAGTANNGMDLDEVPAEPATLCHQADCTQAQMVAFDLAMWKCSLGGMNDEDFCTALRAAGALPSEDDQPGLPGGDGSIAIDADGVITVRVEWQEPDGALRNITIDSQG